MPKRSVWFLLCAILVGGVVIASLLWHLYTRPDRPVATRLWSETMAGMDQQPAILEAFLAERTFVRDGRWDYRWMPMPFRHVWATLRFERGAGPPGPETPTNAEVAEAYQAMGLDDVATLVLKLGEAQGDPRRAGALAAARPRILAARRAYLEAHRAELEGSAAQ